MGLSCRGTRSFRSCKRWFPDVVVHDGDLKAMVAALRHDEPDDFVVATGVSHSIEDFVVAAFAAAGIEDWSVHVKVDTGLLRPNDPADFVGDASKAKRVLGWEPAGARHDDGASRSGAQLAKIKHDPASVAADCDRRA